MLFSGVALVFNVLSPPKGKCTPFNADFGLSDYVSSNSP